MEEKKEAGRGKTVGAVCTASGIIVLLYGIVTAFLMNFNSGIVMVLLPGGALTAAGALYAGWRKYAVFRAVLWAAAAVMIFFSILEKRHSFRIKSKPMKPHSRR